MSQTIRIGTRESELARWQASQVATLLEKAGHSTQLVPIRSEGDIRLDQPLYELGITGIFTKTLDIALLQDRIDLAVHSFKDVPTALPKGLEQFAVLERAPSKDILVFNQRPDLDSDCLIATGSLRRAAQWLHRYPNHQTTDLRGNVNTRLKKLSESNWQGAIFAYAGLERIGLLPEDRMDLDWMIPAPAQGAVMVTGRGKDAILKQAVGEINHHPTEICTQLEREFLRTLEGGCTAPIGALAKWHTDSIEFTGLLNSLDGKTALCVEEQISIDQVEGAGIRLAKNLLNSGGTELMEAIRQSQSK
ncbi:hydroxymethylbilane synthase [Aureitalea marina]|uniref:Hydroxymethylbilane synthase n=1 Tax=Aureitalea marina TaxID=930804 RepID=A0A2S7KSM4_9FLAO|nr:hydroxymethylbilane synthase [Aureitalea marina]PQB05543.1 hydroxymethylbilane synthase [Aureitalea marina]